MPRSTIMTVFGTRPEAIKMAPVVKALRARSDRFETIVCVTAQHRQMLDQVLQVFGIQPDLDLNMLTTLKRFVLATTVLGFAAHAVAADLTLDVYNPGESAIFPVSSVLVSGEKDAILVDAQFGKGHPQAERAARTRRPAGGAAMRIFTACPCRPAHSLREAFG